MCLVWSFEINFFLCCFGISYAVKQKKKLMGKNLMGVLRPSLECDDFERFMTSSIVPRIPIHTHLTPPKNPINLD